MSDQEIAKSDLLEVAKLNGDFRKNYGLIVGAFLYLRSVSAARGGSFWWNGLLVLATGLIALLEKYGWPNLHWGGPT
jgi:hypothetical protein